MAARVFVRDDGAFAGLEALADDMLRFGGEEAFAGQVLAGELQAVEDGVSALDVEVAGGEGIDDKGEGQLDGKSVLKGSDFNVVSILVGVLHLSAVGVSLVAEVEAIVKEAKVQANESGGTAAVSRGVDVTAEWDRHVSSPMGVSPG